MKHITYYLKNFGLVFVVLFSVGGIIFEDGFNAFIGLALSVIITLLLITLLMLIKWMLKARNQKKIDRERAEIARKKRVAEQHRQDDLDDLAHDKRVVEIRRQNKLKRERKVAAEEMRAMQLKALDFTTYEQAQMVSEVVRMKNYDGAKQVLSVLRDPQKIEEALVDISKGQAGDYENAIKVMANSRAKGIKYEDKSIANKVNATVEACIEIGIGALANELNIDIGTQSSSIPKSAIRKTKKWED